MRVTVPIEVDMTAPTINITLPTGTPLTCDVEEAATLFRLSAKELNKLRRQFPDFPVRKVGRAVRYLVPDLYAWFRDQGNIET